MYIFIFILECKEGWYGVNCSKFCLGYCKDNMFCDYMIGYCEKKCDVGWMGL